MYSIGIDVGTTNCKLCLFELSTFKLMDISSFSTPKITTNYGEDFDIDFLYQQIESGLIKMIVSFDKPEQIKNIVIASVGESGVLIDQNEQIIGPAITWYDTRSKDKLIDIKQKFSNKQIYAITGLPMHSNYSLSKILWIKDQYQHDLSNIKWLCIAEYIAFKLTGVKKSERSLASRTMLLNIQTQSWSKELQQAFDLGDIGNDFADSAKNVATLKSSILNQIGQLKIGVAIGGHDHMCGSIAADLKEGEILNSTGTTEGLLLLTKNANFSTEFLNSHLSNGIYVYENTNTIYASLPSAGYTIEWFKKIFSVNDDVFNQLLIDLQPKLSNVEYVQQYKHEIFIPHLRGSGPPNRNIFAKGLCYGFDENTSLENILYAIFKGLCFELLNTLNTIEALTSLDHQIIKVIGAASKSPVWLQLKADILGRQILSCNIKEAVCKGAVMLAGYKNNYIKEPIINHDMNQATQYLPNKNVTDIYAQIFESKYKPFYHLKGQLENDR